jgi:hypothetical protein
MKNFTKDFPLIFNAIYIFAIFVEVVILIMGNSSNLTFNSFIQSYKDVGKSIFFLPWLGLVINVISYLVNLSDGWILGGCLAGIAGFMVLAILPEFFYVGLVFLWIGIFLFYRSFAKRRQRVINHADPK